MKRALIVGSAPCVWEDMAAAPDWPLIVCNAMGLKILGEIELWCSMHGMILYEKMKKRDRLGGDPNYRAYGHSGDHIISPDPRLTLVHRNNPEGIFIGGSSGLFAVMVALSLGYEELILCGVPLEGAHTIQDDRVERMLVRDRDHKDGVRGVYEDFRERWIENEDRLIGKVTSMSGWTRLHFGGPDAAAEEIL